MVAWTDILAAGAADLDLGFSNWRTVTREQAELFAWATRVGPRSNVDPVRTHSARLPQGEEADGYLVLSMAPALLAERIALPDGASVMNYGLNVLRFPTPVRIGQRIRGGFVLTGRNLIEPSMMILKIRSTIELEDRLPAVVADPLIALVRFVPCMDVRRRPKEAET